MHEIRFHDTAAEKDGLSGEMSFLLGEEDYAERMRAEVNVWHRACLQHKVMRSFDRAPIHYYYALTPEARGTVVVVHGYCEYIGKYRELLYVLYKAGYNVFFHEQRGHGQSVRETPQGQFIYVKTFEHYVKDLKCLMDLAVLPAIGATIPETAYRTHPVFMLAHSMGGAVGSLFLEEHPEYFDAAVLCSPMHRMLMGGVPDWKVRALLLAAKIAGLDKKPAPGQGGFDPDERFENSAGMSPARFEQILRLRRRHEEYQTGGATFGWIRAARRASAKLLRNASKVQVPVLLLQAKEDTLVDLKAQELFASRSGNTTIVPFEGAKHELMNGTDEIRKSFYGEVLRFFAKNGHME